MTPRHLIAVASALFAVALPAAPALADAPIAPYVIDIQAARGTPGVDYLINVQNNLDTPAQLVVQQRFVRAPSSLTASGEGKVESGTAAWVLDVGAKELNRVSSAAAFGRGTPTRSTICLTEAATQRVLDCTIGDLPAAAGVRPSHGPRWTVLIGVLIGVAAFSGLVYAAVRWHSRWWPAFVNWAGPRRNTLVVVGAGLAVLMIGALALLFVVGRARPLIAAPSAGKDNIGWSGEQHAIEVGLPAQSRHAEFTIYQWSCATTEATGPQCTATVSIRNLGEKQSAWLSRMQRLHHGSDGWTEPDYGATVAANGGVDPFAAPLAGGERRFASLIFKPQDPATATRLELREGAFAAGVSLNLK